MTQVQVATYLSTELGIAKAQARAALSALSRLTIRELRLKGSMRLTGVGVRRKRLARDRVGQHAITGEQIKIPARTRFTFTAAKALRDL